MAASIYATKDLGYLSYNMDKQSLDHAFPPNVHFQSYKSFFFW